MTANDKAIGESGVREILQRHTHNANAGKQLSKCTVSQLLPIGGVRRSLFLYSLKLKLKYVRYKYKNN